MTFGRNTDEENSRTNGESGSSADAHWGIEMRDRGSMTDDLISATGPPNHTQHTHHMHNSHNHNHGNHNQKVVPNGHATIIGRPPSIRTKTKVTPDLQGGCAMGRNKFRTPQQPTLVEFSEITLCRMLSNLYFNLFVSVYLVQVGPTELSMVIEVFYMLFDRSLSIFIMTSLKQHM